MRATVFAASGLSLQNASMLHATTSYVTLSSQSYASAVDGATTIAVSIAAADLALIKTMPMLATDVSTAYLTATAGVVRDMAGNNLVPVTNTSALQASAVIPDTDLTASIPFPWT